MKVMCVGMEFGYTMIRMVEEACVVVCLQFGCVWNREGSMGVY